MDSRSFEATARVTCSLNCWLLQTTRHQQGQQRTAPSQCLKPTITAIPALSSRAPPPPGFPWCQARADGPALLPGDALAPNHAGAGAPAQRHQPLLQVLRLAGVCVCVGGRGGGGGVRPCGGRRGGHGVGVGGEQWACTGHLGGGMVAGISFLCMPTPAQRHRLLLQALRLAGVWG
jgi:hypothetical protein